MVGDAHSHKGFKMVTGRRFLIASSVARLLRKERGVSTRLVEAHFPPRPERTQLVRVEREHSYLLLRTRSPAGEVQEEQVEVPLSHAEALVEVAAGTVAFDRTLLPLGGEVEAVLDRFIIPQGLDLLTVGIASEPQAFAPLEWFGTEVTGDEAYETSTLALEGLPAFEEVEVTNAAFEALLDTLEGRSPFRFRAPTHQPTSGPDTSGMTPTLQPETRQQEVRETVSTSQPSLREMTVQLMAQLGGGANEVKRQRPGGSGTGVGSKAADATPSATPPPEKISNDVAEATAQPAAADASPQASPEAPIPGAAGTVLDPGKDSAEATSLPHAEEGSSPPEPGPQRRPMFRQNVGQLDEGIARLARSLAPRGPGSKP